MLLKCGGTSLAPYIADARTLQLTLLGGYTGREVEGHDWEAILMTLGWLDYDRTLALWTHGLGVVLMVGSMLWGAWILVNQTRSSG